ncbi:hypothetical protein GN958_ATG02617 [Phytophthora infestans]|uniref:Uncharacterized protein n=1 Tax=Phytophthora infestans TaxID=4787 RepID=A0A8S9V6F9_PHYIN|nr:hypothetical protein GN958_ATG02719 [Phytophthora infestans]KAF4148193.1 hypothetical protein GN958_ATG02617 [Phytophthora infestans]
MVMEHLKGQMQPTLQIDFFEKLLVTAKELSDRRLQAVALEQFISLSSMLELSEPVGGNEVGRPQVADN